MRHARLYASAIRHYAKHLMRTIELSTGGSKSALRNARLSAMGVLAGAELVVRRELHVVEFECPNCGYSIEEDPGFDAGWIECPKCFHTFYEVIDDPAELYWEENQRAYAEKAERERQIAAARENPVVPPSVDPPTT